MSGSSRILVDMMFILMKLDILSWDEVYELVLDMHAIIEFEVMMRLMKALGDARCDMYQ